MPDGEILSYPGYMKVLTDEKGKEIAFCGIVEGFQAMIWSRAESREELCSNIEILLELFAGKTMHDNPGVRSKIGETDYYHN